MSSTPKFCGQCGSSLPPGVRFCIQCGAPVAAAPAAVPAPAPAPVASPVAPAEVIVGIIPGVQQRKGFLGMGVQSFNVVVTPVRLVFAPISQQMMKDAVNTARQEAKSQGKGFLGQVGAQMAWLDVICRQYQTMPVDAVLTQYPGSFMIANAAIKRVRFRQSTDDDTSSTEEMIVEAVSGKYRFELKGMGGGRARQVLRQTLGGLVR